MARLNERELGVARGEHKGSRGIQRAGSANRKRGGVGELLELSIAGVLAWPWSRPRPRYIARLGGRRVGRRRGGGRIGLLLFSCAKEDALGGSRRLERGGLGVGNRWMAGRKRLGRIVGHGAAQGHVGFRRGRDRHVCGGGKEVAKQVGGVTVVVARLRNGQRRLVHLTRGRSPGFFVFRHGAAGVGQGPGGRGAARRGDSRPDAAADSDKRGATRWRHRGSAPALRGITFHSGRRCRCAAPVSPPSTITSGPGPVGRGGSRTGLYPASPDCRAASAALISNAERKCRPARPPPHSRHDSHHRRTRPITAPSPGAAWPAAAHQGHHAHRGHPSIPRSQ